MIFSEFRKHTHNTHSPPVAFRTFALLHHTATALHIYVPFARPTPPPKTTNSNISMRVQDQESNVGTFTPRLPPVPRQSYGSSHPPTQLNGGAPPQQQQQQQQPGVRAPPAPAPAASSPGTAAAAPPRRGCLRANDTQCGWGRGKWGRGNADGGSPCGLKQLGRSIFSLVCFLVLFKVAKCAASIAAFFLGWVVLPAGGMVLSLGAAVIWRLLSTVSGGGGSLALAVCVCVLTLVTPFLPLLCTPTLGSGKS